MANDVTVATAFLKILHDLKNNCINRSNANYPKETVSAYKMLNQYHTESKRSSKQVQHLTQLAFAQTLKCYNCEKLGYTNKTRDDNKRRTGKPEQKRH